MRWRPLPGSEPERFTRVGETVDRILGRLGAPRADVVTRLFEEWPELVGERVASHVRPAGLQGGRLRVRADDPAWASHLHWMEAELLERLASRLGPDAPTGIDVRVGEPSDHRRGRGGTRSRRP